MKAYHHEIIDNVVSYISQKYFQAFQKNITQTLLFKILALFDFRVLKQNGRPCLELSYTARDRGPVPEQLYNVDLSEYKTFKIKDKKNGDYKTRYFISVKTPNLDYLAPSEQKILNLLVEDIIKNKINGSKASDITHKEILAWKTAYNAKHNSVMSYEDEFPGIKDKTINEMTIPELNFKKYMELSNV